MYLNFLRKFILLFMIMSFISPRFNIAEAVNNDLDSPKDIISNITPDARAYHNIRFGVPTESPGLEAHDYVIIQLVYFYNITSPSSLGGTYGGTPQYSVNNNTIRITGITLEPGSYLLINNIQANNPSVPGALDVNIRLAHDYNGISIINLAHILATNTDGSVVLKAEVPANIGQARISGKGAPGMLVAFLENNVAIGTCMVDGNGDFNQVLNGLSPNEHRFLIYGTDSQNRYTPSVEIDVFIRAYVLTVISGILLPPTIELDKTEIEAGESITVSGNGTPGYSVTIYTEAPIENFTTNVNASGDYSYTIDTTTDWDLGDHKAYSILQDDIGNNSLFSFDALFKVVDDSSGDNDHPDCDVTTGDLNCDSHVNLTDFSILLYYWGTSDPFGDVDGDGRVNLIDFSIMMYYWGT